MGIATMWSNLKQKISDELSAYVIKILIDLGKLNNIPEIGKRSLHDQIFTELNDKFDICISDINSTFTAKLGRINNDLNNKFNEEVNAVNNIEEAYRNEFSRINVVIKNLQNEINQHYAVVQRSDFDQQSMSNESEANSTNESETDLTNSSSSSSSQKFANIISVIREQFMEIFERIKDANNYSLDQMCGIVSVDILRLGMRVIGKDTIKDRNGKYGGWLKFPVDETRRLEKKLRKNHIQVKDSHGAKASDKLVYRDYKLKFSKTKKAPVIKEEDGGLADASTQSTLFKK
ncbi:hypothetical protein C1646_752768 [Rhizophagus diaphanus]|nr:hypothetical protein C1646_752768 [Rhizophagus diaphanus] [Rhizophagus sp. MUCL 43196]